MSDALYLRDLAALIDAPAPSLEVQRSYLEQHPRPDKPKRKRNYKLDTSSPHHGNARLLIEIGGETKSAQAWSRLRGFNPQLVGNRINCGWDPVAAVLGNKGESKSDAHARLMRQPTHNHTSKRQIAAERRELRAPPRLIASDARPVSRVVPANEQTATTPIQRLCVIGMRGNGIEFSGHYLLTPDRADELALNLIRMAEDIRRRKA